MISQTHSTETDIKPEKPQRVSKHKNFKLSPELKDIVNADRLTRSDVLKKFWEYIRNNNLQDKETRRKIHADDKLKKIFGKDEVDYKEVLVSSKMEGNYDIGIFEESYGR